MHENSSIMIITYQMPQIIVKRFAYGIGSIKLVHIHNVQATQVCYQLFSNLAERHLTFVKHVGVIFETLSTHGLN